MHCNGAIVPAPELYSEREVFIAELSKFFFRGWTLVDHASRLTHDGQRFLCDVATRSYIVIQEHGGGTHAFRNRCLHAGYPICEEGDTQSGDMLVCKYHDWRYALDGRLLHAPHLASAADRSAYALTRYRVERRAGLLLLAAGTDPAAADPEPPALAIQPPWLDSAQVSWRSDYTFGLNWKHLHWRLPSLLPKFFAPRDNESPRQIRHQPYGPLGIFAIADECAAIFRVIPRSAHETVLNVVWMSPNQGDGLGCPIENAALQDELERSIAVSASYAPDSAAAKFFSAYYALLARPET